MTQLNLDQKAAQYAQQMVNDSVGIKKDAKAVENLITKALGVLQEQGVYACLLFLFSRPDNEQAIAEKIRLALYGLLGELPHFTNSNHLPTRNTSAQSTLEFYSNSICSDLDTLLLVKDTYEQTLIYARFTAKATKAKGD